jgi:thiosulfate/3-mercaptopyruvate sulfurtransferase
VDLDQDLAGPPGGGSGSAEGAGGNRGRHPVPSADGFGARMRALGVRSDRGVVVYDDSDSTAAARAWWLLRYFGHPSVRVLDGGFRAWVAAGLPAERAEPAPGPGDFIARPGQLPLLAADGAAALARRGLLLDARAAERYRGETEPVDPVAGHIPGAVSAPTAQNVNPDGTFRSVAELRRRFAGLGVTEGGAVGAYCGSGVTAAHEVLALALAAIPAALYAGSWSDWITDPGRPVATGAG